MIKNMNLKYIGTIIKTQRTDGCVVLGDVTPRFKGVPKGASIHVGYTQAFARQYVVRDCQTFGSGRFALSLIGITTPEAAQKLTEMGVFADETLVREQSGTEYFEDDLIGCVVLNVETKAVLGKVVEVWYMPANDVWVVDYNGKELPIPAVDAIVKIVDIATKTIEIFVMEGLLELVDDTPNDENDNEEEE